MNQENNNYYYTNNSTTPSYNQYYLTSPTYNCATPSTANYDWSNYQYTNNQNYYYNQNNSYNTSSDYSLNYSQSNNSIYSNSSIQSLPQDQSSPIVPKLVYNSKLAPHHPPESITKTTTTTTTITTQTRKATNTIRHHQLPDHSVEIMNEWFMEHQSNPYPTNEQKEKLAHLGGITIKQVTAWFSNRRNR